ncbi:MMPL family transporter [Ralstonia solanacearum]
MPAALTPARNLHRSAWTTRCLWLAIVLFAACYCGWRLQSGSVLQTNLLALLPATEADPLAERAADTLAASMGDRAVFLVSSRDDRQAKAAARQLGARLAQSDAFRAVVAELPPFDAAQIARFYLPYRAGLLNAGDRAALQNRSASLPDLLAQRLYSPLRTGLGAPLADDPFGWLEHWLADLPLASTRLEIEDNLLVSHQGTTTGVLVTGVLRDSAYESHTQAAVRQAVATAQSDLARAFPDVTMARAGAVFYADAARTASERELHVIGIASTCGIALLMLWVFRSLRVLLLGFASTGIGTLCALAATMAAFGKLHLLTLIFGASLIGEAVDYSIQYFVNHRAVGGMRDPWRSAREVRPALTVALATSLLGYATLVWVPFPALRQLACFAMVGIGAAFLSVIFLLPALMPRQSTQPGRTHERAARWLAAWHHAISHRRTPLVLLLIAAGALPGWMRLGSDDDIHLLVQRDAELSRQEGIIRSAIGVEGGTQFFMVKGSTPEQVLERTEALDEKLAGPIGGALLQGHQSVTQFVPSGHRQQQNRTLLTERVLGAPQGLPTLLAQAGFRPEVASGYLKTVTQTANAPLTVDDWLAMPWSQPYRHLWLGRMTDPASQAPVYATLVIPIGATAAQLPALSSLADGTQGVRFVDKASSVARLFAAYRIGSTWWLAGAMALVLGLFCLRYGWRAGLRVTLPVVFAIGITFSAYGYAGIPLNLFHWLAMMLVLGVGANYAVFLREGCMRNHAEIGAVWIGVALSAATTLLTFGLLGSSAMPVLRSFGMTLASGIIIAVALAPLGMPRPGAQRA